MGTSQSSTGPGGGSPLVPPWADDQPQQPLPEPPPARFSGFRRALGSFVSSGNRDKLTRAVGHYARTASGGGRSASRRLGSVTRAGANLFGALSGIPPAQGEAGVDLASLSGLPCEVAISSITQAFLTEDGDADKIRATMNCALSEALDGIETFDHRHITDDVIADVMIHFLSESIFQQITMDGGKAWNKVETTIQTVNAEMALKELVTVVVDKHMAPQLTGNVRAFSREHMIQLQRQVVLDVWAEWETYQ